MKAIQVKETGGPEKMQSVDLPQPAPGPQQALVKIAAVLVSGCLAVALAGAWEPWR